MSARAMGGQLVARLSAAALVAACGSPGGAAPAVQAPAGSVPQAAANAGATPARAAPGPSPGAPATAPAPSEAAPPELIVGSARGLEAWSTSGKLERLISPGPALHPRWLDGDSIVVIAPRGERDLVDGAEIQRVVVRTGERETVAVLPPFACAPPAEPLVTGEFPLQLDIQDESDVDLDPAHPYLCLRLLDRNINMASLGVSARIDLRTHSVERWLWVGEDVCTPPAAVQLGEPPEPCGTASGETSSGTRDETVGATAAATAYRFDMPDADGKVVERTPSGVKTVLRLGADYSPEMPSPSGRWLVLGGDGVEGDYIYRSLVLLDRQDGHIYPIVTPQGPWPAPLATTGEGARRRVRAPIHGTVQVTGESALSWLQPSPGVELLVVEGTVLQPGVGGFAVDGQLAR
jgi:hypothetical protein